MMADYRNTTGKLTFHDAQIPCILVNEKLEAAAGVKITGWASLLDPALKGKIAIANPTSSSSAWNWMQCLLTDFGGWDKQEAWDYIAKFIPQVKLLDSSSAPLKNTYKGEYVCGLTYEPLVIMNEENCFPGCRVVYWEEGTTSVGFASAIIKGAKNLDNAKLFMDFLQSDAGQQSYLDAAARPATTTKLTGGSARMVDIDTINYKVADTEALAKNKQAICAKWNEYWAKYGKN
jgi:iron(III) transport system substrate-binding protein